MTRVVLTTVGTTGDVVPYLALARGLIARGHQVKLATHALHAELIARAGLEFVPIGTPFSVADVNELMDQASKIDKPLEQYGLIARQMFFHDAEQSLRDHLAAMTDAELVVSSRFDYLGQEAAIHNKLPWVSVTLTPSLLRTDEAPVYPAPKLGRWWTELTWNALEEQARFLNAPLSRALFELGADPRRLDVAGAMSDQLNLVAASPHLCDVRSDWRRNVVVTGAWLDGASHFSPPPELATFLRAHPDPIVVSFGSMGGTRQRETETLLLEALERVGRAAIVQSGPLGLFSETPAPANIHVAGFVPHDFLFAHAACVVHHAGAGTSTAACRAGVPSVAVPHLFDQYYWAGMMAQRGVAPKPLFRPQLTAKSLASRIESALSKGKKKKATALAAQIGSEKGVELAVRELEALMARRATAAPA